MTVVVLRARRRCSAALLGAAFTALAGCPSPQLGEAPFFCNNGDPQCPEGYTCVTTRNICVKDGVVADGRPVTREARAGDGPATPDATTGDGKPVVDGKQPPKDLKLAADLKHGDVKPATDVKPVDGAPTGPITISEFMANPGAVSDADGEWLELTNPGAQAVDINGWTLKDSGTDVHVISAGGPLLIPGGARLLLGRTSSKALNGGVNVGYAYGNDFVLANSSDEIILLDKSGKKVDEVIYGTTGWVIPDGASLSLKQPSANHSSPTSWCTETTIWSGSKGDAGTPGMPAGC